MEDSLLLIFSGILRIMLGGWLLSLCTYSGMLFGFMYGLCCPSRRSIVMSRKFTCLLFASMVMFKLFRLKMSQIFFLMFSACLGVFLVIASPSSRYSPTFMSNCLSCDKMKSPTNSHVSAPSKLPIVTSNLEYVFFSHGVLLSYSKDRLACVIMCFSSSVMLSY